MDEDFIDPKLPDDDGGGEKKESDKGVEHPHQQSEKKDVVELPKDEFEQMSKFVQEQRVQQLIDMAEADIKQHLPDFSVKEVQKYFDDRLAAAKAKSPEEFQKTLEEVKKYNNPTGWEAIHLKHLTKKDVKNDPVNTPRNLREEDWSSVLEKSKRGEATDDEETSLFLKFMK
jgi:hypothetical protein